jgi:hypothetical protein
VGKFTGGNHSARGMKNWETWERRVKEEELKREIRENVCQVLKERFERV